MRGVVVSIFPFLTTTKDGQWSVSHPDRFTPDTHYYRTLGGPQSRCGHFGDDKNTLALQRIEKQVVGDPVSGHAQILKMLKGGTRRHFLIASTLTYGLISTTATIMIFTYINSPACNGTTLHL